MAVVLVLQGGGALGAYQAGAFEALARAGEDIEWVAGTSIGAINAAIIAGNPPERRLARLRSFWEMTGLQTPFGGAAAGWGRDWQESVGAAQVALWGVPGFFRPRLQAPFATLDPELVSLYDTSPLRETLERLVDFDLLNAGPVRFSVGAVEVETGNLGYFDSRRMRIGPEHVMASGALPPGFPPVRIDGKLWWDGGLVSNAPLQYVLDTALHEQIAGEVRDSLVIVQVDVFSAEGPAPVSLAEIEGREKDIRFSSRTRANTDRVRELHEIAEASRRLAAKLPVDWRDDPDLQRIMGAAAEAEVSVVHLIYRSGRHEPGSKDYDFSRASVEERWLAGRRDAQKSLAHADWPGRKPAGTVKRVGLRAFDLARD